MTESYPPVPPRPEDLVEQAPLPPPLGEPPIPMPSESVLRQAAAEPWPVQPLAGEEPQGTGDVLRSSAADLGQSGMQVGQHTVDVARQQASDLAAEVRRQGRDLVGQAREQVAEQAVQGQQRLASRLLSLSDELHSMAETSGQDGMAAGLARQAAGRARDAGQWLGDRRPEDVLDEVQSFARRRPAVFLACALGAGVLAGRLTRGIKAASDDSSADTPATQGTL